MRIMVKGGVWKNTEDEILKAAVMKYGKNQWARIASLLSRKTAKQCKQRWYEWLDPSIKKTEWSREEEEKLLHLAKIMPNQWKTIAPIVGRTAAQCLDHYEKLLDAAQNKEGYDPAEDPRRLRPGEIDPTPEAKPARPDPVDMDEDEKEMLSEARARLANTKGKKAKRKAREKQLEEARRLASLQKRRELKAAGIEIARPRRKVKGVDYNREIPFQKLPTPGSYEVNWQAQKEIEKQEFKKLTLDQLDPKRKRADEDQQKREDMKRQKVREQKNLPEVIMQINKLNDPGQLSQRGKLLLPEPQLDEKGLEEIAKLEGSQDERELVSQLAEGGSSATKTLLPSYKATPTPARGFQTPLRTPLGTRTPVREDTITKEAQNLIALSQTATPLAGGENPELHPSDFSGATPRPTDIKTPNIRAANTPARVTAAKSGDFLTPSRTPLRDSLSLNEEFMSEDNNSLKEQQDALRKQLRAGLSKLPAPQNEYNIVLPDMPEEIAEEEDRIEHDAAEILAKKQKEDSEREAVKLRLRSQVLQRDLPRPNSILPAFAEFKSRNPNPFVAQAEELIRKEMISLISYEAVTYPSKNSLFKDYTDFEDFSERELKTARDLLQEEYGHQSANFSKEEFAEAWDAAHNEFLLVPAQKKYIKSTAVPKKEKIDSSSKEFEQLVLQMNREAEKAKKLEVIVNTYSGGYQKRADELLQQIADMHLELEQKTRELNCFKHLRELESNAIPHRIEQLQRLLKEQTDRESALQQKYRNLKTEQEDLLHSQENNNNPISV